MAYVETWDETKPAGSRDANLGDDDIREFKRGLRERLAAGGMHFPSTDDADAGLYNYNKYIEQSSNPTSEANRAYLFCKDVGGVTELYWMDSAGTVVQVTTAGKLLLTTLGGWVARGDLIRGGATGWQRVAIGTNGQALKSDGVDAVWGDLGFQTAASQAEMEAAASDTVPVTPVKAKFHPGVAKAWCVFDGNTAGTNAPTAGHNVTSVTKNSTGNYTINLTSALSSSAVCLIGSASDGSEALLCAMITASASAPVIETTNGSGTSQDPDLVCVVIYGDL